MDTPVPDRVDLLVIGGGINGAGIARDAAGRGLSVMLVDKDDLAAHTSSSSSKLIHGGLRYLEQLQLRLVAEALGEREVLLAAAPHLVRPVHFVMPHVPELRPAWMIRAGLFAYDYLARRLALDASSAVDLRKSKYGSALKPHLVQGFVYSDCAVDDARLVILNARAAKELGATIRTRTTCVAVERRLRAWQATLSVDEGEKVLVEARALVNATGPWVAQFLSTTAGQRPGFGVRLVKGSHIVVPKLYEGSHAYILQNDDGRVVFACAFENSCTLLGTTDVALDRMPESCEASADEVNYLCRAANRYFARALAPTDVLWSYGGVRPLFDDGSSAPSKVSREYELIIDGNGEEAPVLSLVGGKITVFRRVAEKAVTALAPWFPKLSEPWTSSRALPGGDLGGLSPDEFSNTRLLRDFPWLPADARQGLVRRHGALAYDVIGASRTIADLGQHFGADLYACEVDYFFANEWARTVQDVLWRRTKVGLHLNERQRATLERYCERYVS